MSLVFEALQSLEAERYGVFRATPPEATEMLKCVERRLASNPGALSVGPDVDVPAGEPAKLFPVPSFLGVGASAVTASPERAVSAPYAAAATISMGANAVAVAPAPASVAESIAVEENSVAMSTAAVEAVSEEVSPVSAAAASSVGARAAVAAAPGRATTRMGRAVAMLSSALPMVQKVLNLVDGNKGAAFEKGSVRKPEPAPGARLTAPAIDLMVITNGLAALQSQQRELHAQVVEQNASLVRIEGHLEQVREATHRNTLEQKEMIEDLRGVGSRINVVAAIGLGLLAASVGVNLLIYLRMLKVL